MRCEYRWRCFATFEHGLEYVRADFHLHTKADKEFSFSDDEGKISFKQEYVATLRKNHICVGVITNHNKFDYSEYSALRKVGNKQGVFLLPGVELAVKEGSNGVHTLIVFNPEHWCPAQDKNWIQHFIDRVFPPSAINPGNEKTEKDLKGILNVLDAFNKDYFVIFAHVDDKSGIFTECQYGVLDPIIKSSSFQEHVLGLQKSCSRDNYRTFREHFGRDIARVQGSDPKSIQQIGKGNAVYLKLGEFSFDAVKFALQNFESRVCEHIPEYQHSHIESMSFDGGRLDGQKYEFSPALNTFIGIRGSGKSSILELIAYALGQKPKEDEKYKNGLIKTFLEGGGKVCLSVEDKYHKKYQITREYNKPSVVRSESGVTALSPKDLFTNVLYFGQKDLSQSKEHAKELLEQMVHAQIGNADYQQNAEALSDVVKKLLKISDIPDEIEVRQGELKRLQHSMSVYEERGVSQKLEKQAEAEKDRVQLVSVYQDISALPEKFDNLSVFEESLSNRLSGHKSAYNQDTVQRAISVLSAIDQEIQKIQGIVNAIRKQIEGFKAIQDDLNAKIDALQSEFDAIRNEIQTEDLSSDEYIRMTRQKTRLEGEIRNLRKSQDSKSSLETQWHNLIQKRREILSSMETPYFEKVEQINQSQSQLFIRYQPRADKDFALKVMGNFFEGSNIRAEQYESIYGKLSENSQSADFSTLIEDWILNQGAMLRNLLTPRQYSKLAKKMEEGYRELLCMRIPDNVSISYHGRPLEKHSNGQRASALILFILTQPGNDVLLIDQPEDDLDNQVIYDEVIRNIRKQKPHMQFIFATHNANLPVLGDAERIFTAELRIADDTTTSGGCVKRGNIDCKDTQDDIVSIMEGGREAFNRRTKIYDSWKNKSL